MQLPHTTYLVCMYVCVYYVCVRWSFQSNARAHSSRYRYLYTWCFIGHVRRYRAEAFGLGIVGWYGHVSTKNTDFRVGTHERGASRENQRTQYLFLLVKGSLLRPRRLYYCSCGNSVHVGVVGVVAMLRMVRELVPSRLVVLVAVILLFRS